MNIKDALKPTGKARLKSFPDAYASITYPDSCHAGFITWLFIEEDKEICYVSARDLLCEDWLPYHEVEDIRPTELGELWKDDDGELYFIIREIDHNYFQTINGLQKYTLNIDGTWDRFQNIVHGKNGWTREYPPVEDESVVIEEFEGVTWHREGYDRFMCASGKHGFNTFGHLQGKPAMKLIAIIPKEDDR